MAMSIDAGGRLGNDRPVPDLTVPPAAVWAGGREGVAPSRPVRVRTLDSSNRTRFSPPYGVHVQRHGSGYGIARPVPEAADLLREKGNSGESPRSIMENVKQWAGGAIFGLAIFVGILLSQEAQEEPIEPYGGSQRVGVSLD